mgnify:CR=1 FL=1
MRLLALTAFIFTMSLGGHDAAMAADPAHGASCSGFTAGASACNANGCFVCSGGNWTDQPLYIGTSSATCDASHEGLRRYNSTSHVMEDCNGSVWAGPGRLQLSTYASTCDTNNKGTMRFKTAVTYAAPVVANYTFQGTEGGNVSLAKPSGVSSGDLLLMIISADNNAPWTWPSGFTDIGSNPVTDSGSTDGQTLGIAWKIAGTAEPSNYTTTITGGSLSFSAVMLHITGASPLNPIDVYNYTAITTGVATPPAITLSAPSITPTLNGSLILWIATGDSDVTGNYTYTDPAGMTKIAGPNNNGVWSSVEIAGLAQTTAAATGTLSGTVNLSTSANSTAGIAFSVAIKSPSTLDTVEVCNGTNWMTLAYPH